MASAPEILSTGIIFRALCATRGEQTRRTRAEYRGQFVLYVQQIKLAYLAYKLSPSGHNNRLESQNRA